MPSDLDANIGNSSTPQEPHCEGRLDMAKTILGSDQYNGTIDDGNTPLIRAVDRGSKSAVDLLLSSGASVNFQNPTGKCALWWAAYQGHAEIVESLLQQKDIQVNLPDLDYGLSPLAVAVIQSHERIVTSLLGCRNVDVNSRDQQDRTPIYHAMSWDNEQMAKVLILNNDLDLSIRDTLGFTPLMRCAFYKQTNMMKILLCHPRPQVDVRDFNGRTALWHAVYQANAGAARQLLDHGADVNVQDLAGSTPLHVAVRNGHTKMVHALLALSDIDVNVKDNSGATALWWATWGQHECTTQLLMQPDADVNCVGNLYGTRSTSLHLVIANENMESVPLLLESKSLDPNVTDSLGRTPLAWAASQDQGELMECLLARQDLQINSRGAREPTPLYLAARNRHLRAVQRLLPCQHIDINHAWGHVSPLVAAIAHFHPLVVMELLKCGQHLHIDGQKESVDTFFTSPEHRDIIGNILHDLRLDCTSAGMLRQSALWWVVFTGQEAIVKALLTFIHAHSN